MLYLVLMILIGCLCFRLAVSPDGTIAGYAGKGVCLAPLPGNPAPPQAAAGYLAGLAGRAGRWRAALPPHSPAHHAWPAAKVFEKTAIPPPVGLIRDVLRHAPLLPGVRPRRDGPVAHLAFQPTAARQIRWDT